jgi:hypothetical protein
MSDCIYGCGFLRLTDGYFLLNLYGNYTCVFANLSCWPFKSGQTEPNAGLVWRYSGMRVTKVCSISPSLKSDRKSILSEKTLELPEIIENFVFNKL